MNIKKIREAVVLMAITADRDERHALAAKALAELDKAQQPGKVLTDEEVGEMLDNFLDNASTDGLSRYGLAEEFAYHLRDNGYIAPSAGMTDERPWMNEWQRNMCKKSKASLINIIEEERDENDRLRNLAPAAGLTVDEVMEAIRGHVWAEGEEMHEPNQWLFRARLTAAINTKQKP